MAITAGALIQQGTRVRIRRGTRPIDTEMVGKTGVVIDSSEYYAYKYGVMLDGSQALRVFAPDELEVLALPELKTLDREDAKKRRALP